MKKIVLLLVVMTALFTTKSNSQSATLMGLIAGDTVITSASKDTVIRTVTATGPYHTMGMQIVATKVSGTVVGKAYLYSSLDGVNYIVTDSSAAFTDITTNTAFFTKTTVPYTYYRVHVRSMDGANTTQSVIVRIYYVFRRSYP